MAEYVILSSDGVYYTIKVTVNGVEYQQTIVSNKTGAELTALLQAYANDYQAGIDAQTQE